MNKCYHLQPAATIAVLSKYRGSKHLRSKLQAIVPG